MKPRHRHESFNRPCLAFEECKRRDRHVHCFVPHCSHTSSAFAMEWICAEHWLAVPKMFRRVYSRSRKRAERSGDFMTTSRLWRRVRREAMEKAGGI